MHKGTIQYFLMLQEYFFKKYLTALLCLACRTTELIQFFFFIFYGTRLAGSSHIQLYIDDPFSLDTLFVLNF